MNANATKAKESGTPSKAQLKQLVRNDETFIGLYTQILAALHARRKRSVEGLYEHDVHEICASLAKWAYIGACHGYAQLKLAEPDEEIEAFNQTVEVEPGASGPVGPEDNHNNHNH